MRSRRGAFLLLLVAACGGRVVSTEGDRATRPASPATSTSPSASPTSTSTATPTTPSPQPNEAACNESLDQYCASSTSCVQNWSDAQEPIWCDGTGSNRAFIATCGSVDAIVVAQTDTSITYYYRDGKLVAVVHDGNFGKTCLAGPADFAIPDDSTCTLSPDLCDGTIVGGG